MIKAMLIDDEPNNTQYVKELLELYFPLVNIGAISNDPVVALSLIRELNPQLVFMDVEMPGLSGFELLKVFEPLSFEVIFITAYSHYALQAFDINAVGYLTKPVQVDKFIKVVTNAIHRIGEQDINRNLFTMLQVHTVKDNNSKIALPTQSGLLFIAPDDILYCHSSGNYTKIFTRGGKTILVSRQLGEFEKLLSPEEFHRIHDQYIIRLQYIKEYIRGRGGDLVMENNETLPVSASCKESFLLRFEKWLRKG